MRVLITNSLVLAAISLAPVASAAPYTTASSVDSYDSYPNSTTLAQDSGPSAVPSMLYPYGRTINLSRPTSPLDARRDEIIHVQSLYDGSPFGSVFGPIAGLFGTIGMNTISDNVPLTEVQKTVLDKLHDALNDAAGSVIANLPANHPLSPLSSRSLEDREVVNPLEILGSLPILGSSLAPVRDLLLGVGIGPNSAGPLTDLQKQVIARLQTAIGNAVGDVTAHVPVKLDILPFGHQSRSIEERSLEDILSLVNHVPFLSSLLSPVTGLISSLGVPNGAPLNDAQKQLLSQLQAAIAAAAQNVESHIPSIHIEHAREEHEHWAHDNHHDPHMDGHDAHKDDRKPQDVHKDDHQPQDVHEDDHKSPNAHEGDREVQSVDREGDRGREPRDGQRDERHRWDDWKHRDGKGRDGKSSLLGINLGGSCRS
jgi:hypothetical protein